STPSCESKGWEEIAQELLGDAEPEFCDEADDQLLSTFEAENKSEDEEDAETDNDSDGEDDAELAFKDITAATSVVGVGRDGETVILVDKDDEEIFDFLEAAYPG